MWLSESQLDEIIDASGLPECPSRDAQAISERTGATAQMVIRHQSRYIIRTVSELAI